MKKIFIFTCVFCTFLVIFSFFFCAFLSSFLLSKFGFDFFPLYLLCSFVVCAVVHDYVCRYIICAIRKKCNVTDGCYFWNCPHYSVCPYNSNK